MYKEFKRLSIKLIEKKEKKGNIETRDMMKVVRKWQVKSLRDWKRYQENNLNAKLIDFLKSCRYITNKLAIAITSTYDDVSKLENLIQLDFDDAGTVNDPRHNQKRKLYPTFIINNQKKLWRYCGYCFEGDFIRFDEIYEVYGKK